MALDIVGPANAPNATTIRPTDTRTFGATDTWTKDCTSAAANDGTKIQAGFLNGIIAQVRNLIRGNGQTAGSADIVTLDNADDSMALKAIQHLTQRGLMKYAADTSVSANTVTIALTPALAEYKAGLEVMVKVANTNTGATNININALGNKAIKTITGADLLAGSLLAGGMVKLAYDGTNFQVISALGPAAFSQPKATLTMAAISSLSHATFASHNLSLVSSTDVTPVISTNTVTLPTGTYAIQINVAVTIILTNNATQTGFHCRLLKNGSEVQRGVEATYLISGQNATMYPGFAGTVQVNGTDTLTVQSLVGCTFAADYGGGNSPGGSISFQRIGP